MAGTTLQQYHEEAKALVHRGRPDKAMDICLQILQHFPRHLASYRLLGQTCLIQGDYESAADIFCRVLSADPQDLAAYTGLAVIHEEEGALDEALWHMERAFDLAPGNPAVRTELARLRQQQGVALSERLNLTRAALARLHFRAGQWWRAVAQCQSVLATDPARADVRLLLAETLWHGGQHQASGQVCQDLLADLPDCLKANLMRGTILAATDPSVAEACLAVAQALDPENLVAQELLGSESPLTVREIRLELEEGIPASEGPLAVPEPDEAWSTRLPEPLWRRALRRLIEKR